MCWCVGVIITHPTAGVDRFAPVTPLTVKFILSSEIYEILDTRHGISDGVGSSALDHHHLSGHMQTDTNVHF